MSVMNSGGRRAKAITVKVGNVAVKIYRTPSRGHELYTLAWYEAGKRKRQTFADLNEAKKEANLIAAKLSRGQHIVLELSAADRESYGLAIDALRQLGIPLHVAVQEFVEARKLLPDGCALTAAVENFAQRHRSSSGKKSVGEVVEEFLKARKGEVGVRQMNDLRVHLASLKTHPPGKYVRKRKLQPFADRFRCSIGAVTSADIDKWLADAGGGPKRWNNVRSSVVAMFGWAQRKGYLPRDAKTEAEMSARKRYRNKQPQILSPEELSRLLAIEDEEARLYILFGAYCGIRAAEILRMTWEAIHFETGVIALGPDITKNGTQRTLPICPSLGMWLAPYRGRKGRIFTRVKSGGVIQLARTAVHSWPPNGLRHSFGSYRLAQTDSKEKVSNEMGNSPQMVERHYKAITTRDGRVVTRILADAWFSILPPRPSNVVQMAQAS